jgi:hypothetical protein
MTGHISPDLEGRVRPLRARVVAKPELMRNLRDVVRQSDPRLAH